MLCNLLSPGTLPVLTEMVASIPVPLYEAVGVTGWSREAGRCARRSIVASQMVESAYQFEAEYMHMLFLYKSFK